MGYKFAENGKSLLSGHYLYYLYRLFKPGGHGGSRRGDRRVFLTFPDFSKKAFKKKKAIGH